MFLTQEQESIRDLARDFVERELKPVSKQFSHQPIIFYNKNFCHERLSNNQPTESLAHDERSSHNRFEFG